MWVEKNRKRFENFEETIEKCWKKLRFKFLLGLGLVKSLRMFQFQIFLEIGPLSIVDIIMLLLTLSSIFISTEWITSLPFVIIGF